MIGDVLCPRLHCSAGCGAAAAVGKVGPLLVGPLIGVKYVPYQNPACAGGVFFCRTSGVLMSYSAEDRRRAGVEVHPGPQSALVGQEPFAALPHRHRSRAFRPKFPRCRPRGPARSTISEAICSASSDGPGAFTRASIPRSGGLGSDAKGRRAMVRTWPETSSFNRRDRGFDVPEVLDVPRPGGLLGGSEAM